MIFKKIRSGNRIAKFILAGILFFSYALSAASWQTIGVPCFSAGQVVYTSIALDNTNKPYIAYKDVGLGNKAVVKKYNNSNWEAVGTVGFSAGQANYTSLAIDSSGTPYVAYQDVSNNSKLTVMKYNGTSWEALGGAGFTAGQASYALSLALDSTGAPYVAFSDGANSGKATVMKYNGTSWETVGTAGFSTGYIDTVSLKIGSGDVPYLVYRDGNANKVILMKYSGGSWTAVGSNIFSASGTTYLSLAINSSGTPYVACYDPANSGKATVWKYNDTSWETVGSAGFSAGTAMYISLALDSTGAPYVAYQDPGSSYKTTVMKFNGSTWTAVGSAGFTSGDSYYQSLVIGTNDILYVGYSDYSSGGLRATVKAYTSYDFTIPGVPGTLTNTAWTTASDPANLDFTDATDTGGSGISLNGYDIYWGKDPAGTSPIVKTGTSDYDPPALTEYGMYFLRARARDVSGNIGAWSTVTCYQYYGGNTSSQLIGTAGFTAGQSNYISLAFDASYTPYILYCDSANSSKASVMKYINGSGWVQVGTAGFSAGTAQYGSLAFDSTGAPYIAFQDGANSGKATVMKFNGTDWELVGSAGFSAGGASYISLVMNSSDTPYVSYTDGGNSSKATVMKYNGTAWEPVGSVGFSTSSAYYTSLAINSSGTPYVVYSDAGNSNKATVMKYNGSAWETVGGAGISTGLAQFTSLAFDPSGTPYVAFSDGSNNYKTTVMKYNGTNWVLVGNAGFSNGVSNYISLAMDSSGTPYVAYNDSGNSSKATVMKYYSSNNIWLPLYHGFSAGIAYYTSLAFDNRDIPYIAYSDGSNSYKVTVQAITKFDLANPGVPGTLTNTAWTTVADPANLNFTDSSDNTGGSGIDLSGYDIYWGKDPTGTSPIVKTGTSDYDPPALTEYGAYYLRARAKDVSGNIGAWSTIMRYQYYGGNVPAQVIGKVGFSSGQANNTSLALDASNTPYIAYIDYANSNKVTVMKYLNETGWVLVGSAGFSTGAASYVSLAIDNNGTPNVAYSDSGNSNKATVMKYNGTAWELVGTAGFSAGAALYNISLVIDPDNNLYVAYGDGANSYKATVMKYNGTSWATVGTAGFSVGQVYPSLALDSSNTLYIAYLDNGNSGKATVKKFDGANWVTVGTAGFSADRVTYISIALDPSGTPYVVYQDSGNSSRATVKKYNGTAWETVGVVGFSVGSVAYTAIDIDANGVPYVAYHDSGNNKVSVMKYNSSINSWLPENYGFSAGSISCASLVLDSSGIPYVAYSDGGNSSKATVQAITKLDLTKPGVPGTISNTGWTTLADPPNKDFAEATDPSGSGISLNAYDIYWGKDPAGISPIVKIGTSDYDPPALAEYGTYFLRARAKDVSGNIGAWTTITRYEYYGGNVTAQNIGTAGFTTGSTAYTSLTIDQSGTPYIAFQDTANSNKATVLKYVSGSGWTTVGTAGFSAGTATFTTLAIDNSGTPYVFYRDVANSNKATVMKYNGAAWEVVGTAGFSAGTITYISMAINSSGTPYVAYEDGGNSNKLTVMKYNGTNWEAVGGVGISTGIAQFASLAFDSSDTPYVAYEDLTNSYRATIKKFNGTSWDLVGSAISSAGIAQYLSLVIASDSTPYIAYQDLGNTNRVVVMKFNGTNWVPVGLNGFSTGVANDISLAMDDTDSLYVAFQDGANSFKATVMKYNSLINSWLPVNVGFSASQAGNVSLAINKINNVPYVGYYDSGYSNKATVMKLQPILAPAYDLTAPGRPGVLANMVTTNANPLLLDFAEATDNVGGSGIDTNGYQIYWGFNLNGTTPLAKTGTSEYDPPLLSSFGTYFLRARAKDVSGNYGVWRTICSYQYDPPAAQYNDLPLQFQDNVGTNYPDITPYDSVYLVGLDPTSNEQQARVNIDKNSLGVATLVSSNFSDIVIKKTDGGITNIEVPSTGYLGSIVNTAKSNSTPIWVALEIMRNNTKRPILTLDNGSGAQAITDYELSPKSGVDRLRNLSLAGDRISFEVNEFSTYGIAFVQQVNFIDKEIITTNFNVSQIITVNVLDTEGEGVENAPVTFSIQSGSGLLAGGTAAIVVRTNTSGVATINYTFPNGPGTNIVRAQVEDVFDTITLRITSDLNPAEEVLYNAWVTGYGAIGGLNDDPDGDGVRNILEWNWGFDSTNPTLPDTDNDGLNDKYDAYPNNISLQVFRSEFDPVLPSAETFTGTSRNTLIVAPSTNLILNYGTHTRAATSNGIVNDNHTVLKISGLTKEAVRDGNLAFASTRYDGSKELYRSLKPGETYSVQLAYINRGNAADTYVANVNLVQAASRWTTSYSNSGLTNVAAWQQANIEVNVLPTNALAFEKTTLNIQIDYAAGTAVSYNRFVNAYPGNTYNNEGYYGGDDGYSYSFWLEAQGYDLTFVNRSVTVNAPAGYTGKPVSLANLVPGAKLIYSIAVRNNSFSVAASVNVKDKIPNNCHLFYTDTPSVEGATAWTWQGAINNTADKDTADAVKYEITIPARGTVTASYTVTVD